MAMPISVSNKYFSIRKHPAAFNGAETSDGEEANTTHIATFTFTYTCVNAAPVDGEHMHIEINRGNFPSVGSKRLTADQNLWIQSSDMNGTWLINSEAPYNCLGWFRLWFNWVIVGLVTFNINQDGEIDFLAGQEGRRGANREREVCYNISLVFANDTKLISTAPGISCRLCNTAWFTALSLVLFTELSESSASSLLPLAITHCDPLFINISICKQDKEYPYISAFYVTACLMEFFQNEAFLPLLYIECIYI